jgi:hypothetical protein
MSEPNTTGAVAPLQPKPVEAKPAASVAPAAAADIEASGAVMEPKATADVPMDHPAVESNPRAGLPAESSRIDFNDPTLPGHEAVARNLRDQGIGSVEKA